VDCRRLGSVLEKDAMCPGYHEIAGGSGGPRSTIAPKIECLRWQWPGVKVSVILNPLLL
jgi:hypothetical protein